MAERIGDRAHPVAPELILDRHRLGRTGIADGHKGNISEATRFAVGITLSVVAAIVFAAFLGPEPPLGGAVLWGLAVGLAFITTSFGIQHLFEGRTARVALINGGYHTAQFALFGVILGLWH